MSDEPFRFAISPVVTEKNARRLIDVMAQFFPGGATSDDLRIKFEEVTTLRRQSFYDTIAYAKYRHWIVGGGHSKLYQFNSDGSWKPPPPTSAGLKLEKDQLEYLADLRAQQIEGLLDEVERLRDWGSGGGANGAGVAVSTLAQIVSDNAAGMRQRLKAASAILAYKVQDDDVVEFTKRFLQSVCISTDIATDYRIEAGELLRKHEAPRIMSEIVRPTYRENEGSEASRIEAWRDYEIKQRELKIILATRDVPPPGWDDDLISDNYVPPAEGWPGPAPQIPLKDLVVARRARQNRLEREAIERLRHVSSERPQLLALLASQRRKGNGGDGTSD